jgi:hypothetical protein
MPIIAAAGSPRISAAAQPARPPQHATAYPPKSSGTTRAASRAEQRPEGVRATSAAQTIASTGIRELMPERPAAVEAREQEPRGQQHDEPHEPYRLIGASAGTSARR